VLLVGILALAGWQADWPSAIFGAKRSAALLPGGQRQAKRSPITSPVSSPPSSLTPPASSPTPSTSNSTPPASQSTANPVGGPAPAQGSPAAVVLAYFAAITARDYARAWKLGGVNTGMGSYAAFADGFATTASDHVTIMSVSGDVVTARLTATQTDGSVKTFEGTYTVVGRVIVQFEVQQIS
jgi:eukaryotic-like serine/threonine-protein kinase